MRRAAILASGALGIACVGTAYGFWEASQIRVNRQMIPVRDLPANWVGTTIGVLADRFICRGWVGPSRRRSTDRNICVGWCKGQRRQSWCRAAWAKRGFPCG